MKRDYFFLAGIAGLFLLILFTAGVAGDKIRSLEVQLILLEEDLTSLDTKVEQSSITTEHDLTLLDSKIDTLESVIDKDKKRKVQINKVVAAIKSDLPSTNPCPETMNSGELLRVAGAVVDLSERYAVPAALVLGVIRQESAFCQKAISPVGAQGYMQIMPETAAQICQEIGISLNVWSSRDNIHLGVAYLSHLLTMFNGDISLATKAYNAGPTHVRKVVAGVIKDYFPESLDYSEKVQRYQKMYELAGVTW